VFSVTETRFWRFDGSVLVHPVIVRKVFMTRFSQKQIRNIGIAAHIDAGKTTTTERMLFFTGRIHRTGEVHDGNATMDYLKVERTRGITVTAAATSVTWSRFERDFALNIIDTPGHVDFTLEVERAMRVLDGAVAVFDASEGVEPQSETVWRQADKYGVPRIAFVNKMDKVGVDFDFVLRDIVEKLGARVAPLQLPWFEDEQFVGVIDVLELCAWQYEDKQSRIVGVPETMFEAASKARRALVELAAEFDSGVLEVWASGSAVPNDALRSALRTATTRGEIVPVLCGASLENIGIEPLLNAVVDYLPSPLEVPEVIGLDELNQEHRFSSDENASLAAFVFKLMTDEYVGRFAFVRVYNGTLEAGAMVLNTATGKRERIGKLVKMHAKTFETVSSLRAGELGAILGAKAFGTGDTLVGPDDAAVRLEAFSLPESVISLALTPKSRADQDKLSHALAKLSAEDPSLLLRTDADSGELLISGMGELHLEVTVERLRDEHQVEVKVSAPRVAYRETIAGNAELEVLHKKQEGGNGQYAKMNVRIDALTRGAGFEFVDAISGGAVTKSFIEAFRKGFTAALVSGQHGYPITDLRIVVTDGAMHREDSSEFAFYAAGMLAVRQMLERCGSQLLEPIMRVDATTPERFVGDVIGSLNARRGRIEGIETRGTSTVIRARAPLEALFGYAGTLRSLTQGRASFSMQLEGYEVAPVKQTA
jgi:elongation factor G